MQYPETRSPNHDSPSVDIMCGQEVAKHRRMNDDYATLLFMWKSKRCLHSLTLLYSYEDDGDDQGYDYGWSDNDMYYGDDAYEESDDDEIYWDVGRR